MTDTGVVLLVRPPVLYAVSILLGLLLDLWWPAAVFPRAIRPLGGLLVSLAILLFALAVRELKRAATPIRSRRAVAALVTTGPYRLSRNPIYLAFTTFQLGLGLWVNNAWIVGLLLPTVVVMAYGVIAREERYLAQRFADRYLQYRGSVRRWL
jgi:protein-S-isoprenylcysteine O-methyltransferase Ste14